MKQHSCVYTPAFSRDLSKAFQPKILTGGMFTYLYENQNKNVPSEKILPQCKFCFYSLYDREVTRQDGYSYVIADTLCKKNY